MNKMIKKIISTTLAFSMVLIICAMPSEKEVKAIEVEQKENVNIKEKEASKEETSTKLHKKFQVTEKKKFKHLTPQEKTAINLSLIQSEENGKKAAEYLNEFKEDKKEFKIGVRKVLDKYYSMKKNKRGELKAFTKELDDSAKQIVENYEEAEKERENQENLNYETEEVLLSFPHGTPMETIETIIGNEAVDYEVVSDGERHIPEDLPEYKKERLAKAGDIKRDVVILAETSLEDTVKRAEEKFKDYACVEAAEHNVYFEADGTVSQSGYSATTNDPKFTNDIQWNLKNANVPRAWNRFKTANGVYQIWVAVIDCGVKMNHPDLKNVLLTKYSVDVTQRPAKKLINCSESQQYTGEHGTRVAGVLMAQANNGVGMAGMASVGNVSVFRNPCRLMAIKCDWDGKGRHITNKHLATGINYAVDNGAEVINISYSATKGDYGDNFNAVKKAIAEAIDQGVIVVCSAGNDGDDGTKNAGKLVRYPAGFGGVIGVGAIYKNGVMADYSNESAAVDIVAPGGSKHAGHAKIFTTDPKSGYVNNCRGTSYATPLVAGTVAMMCSLNCDLTPKKALKWLQTHCNTKPAIGRKTGKEFDVLNAGYAVATIPET